MIASNACHMVASLAFCDEYFAIRAFFPFSIIFLKVDIASAFVPLVHTLRTIFHIAFVAFKIVLCFYSQPFAMLRGT